MGTCDGCGRAAGEVLCQGCGEARDTLRARDAESAADLAEQEKKHAQTRLHDALLGLAEAASALRRSNQRAAAIRAENTIAEVRAERRPQRRAMR